MDADPNSIHILVVSRSPLICLGYVTFFQSCIGMQIVGEARILDEALALHEQLQPHVIVVDLTYFTVNDLERLGQLCQDHPDLDIFALLDEIQETLTAGYPLATCVNKLSKFGTSITQVEQVIRQVYAQRIVLPHVPFQNTRSQN